MNEENLVAKVFSLTEILVKTTYQVVISKEITFQSNPIAFGAGFFINYKNNLFFLTADHNIHIEDHEINERTGVDNYLAVLNNISDINSISTLMTPIGGFHYMEKINIINEGLKPELIDVAISLIDRKTHKYPFVTDEDFKDEQNQSLVSPNEQKFEFIEENISEPKEADTYYVYGKIKPHFKGLFLQREYRFKNDLKYVGTYGDYVLLNTPVEIEYEEWAGLSGSPVLNQEGKCIGILCSVNNGTKSVFVKPFNKILPFLDVIILQSTIDKSHTEK